ncbi:MAG: hypothetical protein IT236_17085, partial [Bacteroidia bacterium]|nr:hypothetical protein [Bacteroidia bacterium]
MFNPQVDSNNNQLKDITEKFNNGIDIGVMAFLFNKSRYYIILFFLISFFTAFIYLRYSQPNYESKAVLQIKDENKAGDILKFSSQGENNNVLAEAIEQIKSKVFLKRVVEKLEINVNYFSEGTFKNNELYNLSPYFIKINPRNPSVYGQKIYVEINKDLTGGVIKAGKTSTAFTNNEWLKLADYDVNIYVNQKLSAGQIKQILKENKAFYFTVADNNAVTQGLQSKLEVRVQSELAKTVLVKVKDVNATKATDIVNAITEEFKDYDVELKSESSRKILEFINEKLGDVYNDLRDTENDLQKFKNDKNLSEKSEIATSEMARYSS